MKHQEVIKKFNFFFASLFFLLIVLSSSKVNYAQEEIVRVETNLVTIPATIMDRNGRYITNLKKEDFRIFEDGVEQEIEFFEPVEEPFTIFFLLDVSGSMNNYMYDLARAANAFFNQLRLEDRITVVSFCEYLNVRSDSTLVKEIRGIKIFKLKRCGNTRLYDAVDFALKRMNKIRGRKAIVLFSDGYDSGITANSPAIFSTSKSNLKDAEEIDSLIYTIQFNDDPTEPPKYINKKAYFKSIEAANNYMRDLAEKTGGRHYRVEDVSNLEETFKMVAEELGRQYRLGYYPKLSGKAGERRHIKVKVDVPNAAVRSRNSYIVGANKK